MSINQERRKQLYTRILADIPKKLGDEFKHKLQKDNIKITDWMKQNAKNYLKGK